MHPILRSVEGLVRLFVRICANPAIWIGALRVNLDGNSLPERNFGPEYANINKGH